MRLLFMLGTLGFMIAAVGWLFARSPLEAVATEGKTEADVVGTIRCMSFLGIVPSLGLFPRPLPDAAATGSKSEAMLGLLVRWLFARHPLDAPATGGKTEA